MTNGDTEFYLYPAGAGQRVLQIFAPASPLCSLERPQHSRGLCRRKRVREKSTVTESKQIKNDDEKDDKIGDM